MGTWTRRKVRKKVNGTRVDWAFRTLEKVGVPISSHGLAKRSGWRVSVEDCSKAIQALLRTGRARVDHEKFEPGSGKSKGKRGAKAMVKRKFYVAVTTGDAIDEPRITFDALLSAWPLGNPAPVIGGIQSAATRVHMMDRGNERDDEGEA